MKHHLYQIYYGGFKTLLPNAYYCSICNMLMDSNHHKIQHLQKIPIHGDKIQLQPDKKQRHFNDK